MSTFLHVGCGPKRKDQTTRGFNSPDWQEIRFDIDASVQQFLDILPALGMTTFRRIRMCEFVDDQQLGLAGKSRVEIEFVEPPIPIVHSPARQDFEPRHQSRGLGASVRLDQAYHDVGAAGLQALRVLQHRIGLADPRCGAQKDFQPAARLAL